MAEVACQARFELYVPTSPEGEAIKAYVDALIGIYELNRVELLRDVFVAAYERCCQQYVAVQQNLVPPDILRLRYRQALSEVVGAIIRSGESAAEVTIRARTPTAVAEGDKDHFVRLVLDEFKALHAGNVVRFGIRPLEFAEWLKRQSKEEQAGRGVGWAAPSV